jgi:uncharacterized membrane protein YebE (DUF533 family)
MPSAQRFFGRILMMARNRDGQAHALEEGAEGGEAVEEAAPPPTRRHRQGPEAHRIVQEALAGKLLDGWLQARQRTLFPLTLDFARLDADGSALLVRMMVAAAEADGEVDRPDQDRIAAVLAARGGGEAERRMLAEAIQTPMPLGALLRQVQEARLGAQGFAASLLALDRRSRVNQAWLDYLAARLGLPAAVVDGLKRRYRG